MSTPSTFKRRRLNESASTLSKPFVSPLRSLKSDLTPLKQNDNAANTSYQPSVLAHTTNASPPAVFKPTSIEIESFSPAKSTPIRRYPAFATTKSSDPAELAAQKALTALELQIRAVRNDIDKLRQAAQINSSTTDANLKVLAQKWKAASQSAADELFETVHERVCQMGGVAAWRESERRKYDRGSGLDECQEDVKNDDADCEFDSQGEELPEAEQESRKAAKRKAKREMDEAADPDETGVRREEDDRKEPWPEEGCDDEVASKDNPRFIVWPR